jgi:hypothetical protein
MTKNFVVMKQVPEVKMIDSELWVLIQVSEAATTAFYIQHTCYQKRI